PTTVSAWGRLPAAHSDCVGRSRSPGEARRTTASHTGHYFTACLTEEIFRMLLEIFDDLVVVVAVTEVDLENGNAPVVFYLGIELDEIHLAREHLATRYPNPRLRHIAALDF